MGFFDTPQPVIVPALSASPCRNSAWRREGCASRPPPEATASASSTPSIRCRTGIAPLGRQLVDARRIPYHAITQRPMAMYHSWGSMNAWLRQIHTKNPLYVPGPICDGTGLVGRRLGLGDLAPRPHQGRDARMEAVNSDTMWTWNAIGKRRAPGGLTRMRRKRTKGFLLNHLIHELLPPKGDGMRWSNSDPVTGQAAWYDLRVRIEKAEAGEVSEPHFAGNRRTPGSAEPHPIVLAMAQEWAK